MPDDSFFIDLSREEDPEEYPLMLDADNFPVPGHFTLFLYQRIEFCQLNLSLVRAGLLVANVNWQAMIDWYCNVLLFYARNG